MTLPCGLGSYQGHIHASRDLGTASHAARGVGIRAGGRKASRSSASSASFMHTRLRCRSRSKMRHENSHRGQGESQAGLCTRKHGSEASQRPVTSAAAPPGEATGAPPPGEATGEESRMLTRPSSLGSAATLSSSLGDSSTLEPPAAAAMHSSPRTTGGPQSPPSRN